MSTPFCIHFEVLSIQKAHHTCIVDWVSPRSMAIYLANTCTLPELKISVKIVSGVKQGGIPDTIKMSEAAGQ